MNKKQARRSIKQLQRVKTWQLFALLILMLFVSAAFLRLNNIGMVERRTAVYDADNSGDVAVMQSRLYDLQRYVSDHMNTDLGKGVYLVATYNRDYQAALTKAATATNANGNIYKKAQEVCAPQFSYWSQVYVQCTANEIAKYPASANLATAVSLPTDAYLYSFVSPVWSPDFAGWSLLISVVIFIMILVRLIGVAILRLILHYRYRGL